MNKLIEVLRNLFRKSELTPSEVPFLHEPIDVNLIDENDYLQWSGSNEARTMKNTLRTAFYDYIIHHKTLDPNVEFWYQPASKGFVFFNQSDTPFSKIDFIYFQFGIYLKLKELNYILNLADVSSRQKASWVEMIRRFYLKPSSKIQQGQKTDQLYGNIHLEYIERNDEPYMFRLLANTYQDRNYHQERDFNELIEIIVNPEW